MLIGCDGSNSVISNYIGLKSTRLFSRSAVRGLTVYPNGHGYAPEFLRLRKEKILIGRIPIDEKTVYWFVVLHWNEGGKLPTIYYWIVLQVRLSGLFASLHYSSHS